MKPVANDIKVRENSWIAAIAARKLKCDKVAIVIGDKVHLHNTTKISFLNDERWLKHELCHLRQFRENGFLLFIIKYVWESLLHGYYKNKYEVEAREAESL